jgi:membrane protein YqaA with SNARE-associated domain
MLAYLTLFAWSALAATLIPIGSEAAVVVMGQQRYAPAAIVVVATAGNYLGACTTYWLARKARAALTAHDSDSERESRAARLMARYGQASLLFTWVPLVGDALVAVAGFTGVRFLPFSLWTATGKLLRYVAVVWGAQAFF